MRQESRPAQLVPQRTLVDLLLMRGNTQPNDLAYTFLREEESPAATVTFGQLDREARAIAATLQDAGARGERALLLYHPGTEYQAAFFGCLYAGVVPVPIYPPRQNRKLGRIQSVVADSGARFALTTAAVFNGLERHLGEEAGRRHLQWIVTDRLEVGIEQHWKEYRPSPDDLAFLQYTSGSTGTPKGVMVSHGNLMHNSSIIVDAFQVTPADVGVIWLPPYHDMGLIGGLLQSVYVGMHVCLLSPTAFLQRPLRWLQAISKFRGTMSGGPDFAYDLCAQKVAPEDLASLDLRSWRLAFTGAEPVRRDTISRFVEAFGPCGFTGNTFYPCYGLAEATLMVSGGDAGVPPVVRAVDRAALQVNRVEPVEEGAHNALALVACGRTRLDQEIRIVNPETMEPCADLKVGEVWLKGPSVAQGYWERPADTEAAFGGRLAGGEGPYLRTGDLGFLDRGQLYITGRIKDLIIIRGRNHYPQDIETTVQAAHEAVRPSSAAVFGITEAGEERLVVVLEIARHCKVPDQVVEAVRHRVAEEHELHVCAVACIKQATMPKTSSGKIQRFACRDEFLTGSLELVHEWRAGSAAALDEAVLLDGGTVKAGGHSTAEITAWLIDQLARRLGLDARRIDVHTPFAAYGLDSLQAVNLSGELETWLGRSLSPTLVWDYPSLDALARYLAGEAKQPGTLGAPVPQEDAVAIVGMACRFPGAGDLNAFWSLLHNEGDAIREVPADRWDAAALYDPQPGAPGKVSTRWGGFVDGVDQFDAGFFGISPREAARVDPQQRLLLEVTWEALEHAGIPAEALSGSRTGVFVGISTNDYAQRQMADLSLADAYTGTGNANSIAANRISYQLNLLGPSMAIDTACSSALVALHLARQSLAQGDCNAALVGGVNLMLSPALTVVFSHANMMAADGRCKTFDARADGYARGEGCGVVVLKRLADAQRDGDRILAVVRGSAVNQDGHSNGLTAPNGLAQQAVIWEALHRAGARPADLTYIEAHGTGTSLGDPIEMRSLMEVLSADNTDRPCYIGSVKTNIGHLEAAAGIAGVIKTVLALQNQEIPPHLHFREINPHISLADTRIRIPTEPQPWPTGDRQRLAGVSSFGFGGTNAHVILEEAPRVEREAADTDRPAHVLCLSARSDAALHALASQYERFLAEMEERLGDVCYTANTGRTLMPYRRGFAARSAEELRTQLARFARGQDTAEPLYGVLERGARSLTGFLFTGQGAQYAGMGRALYNTQPVFRQALHRCATLLEGELDCPLLTVLFPPEGEPSPMDDTAYAQPALFAIEYALLELWRSWGIEPDAVMGHSLGEYIAAYAAGVMTLEDGLRLAAARGRLMSRLPRTGLMAAIFTDAARVGAALTGREAEVSIAAVNGPQHTVIAGDRETVEGILAGFEAEGVLIRRLTTSHAFHSPLIEPMLDEFEQVVRRMQFQAPRLPWVSNLTGRLMEQAPDPEYWRQHVRQAVQFATGIETMSELGCRVFLELGPEPHLCGMGRRCLDDRSHTWLASLRDGQDDWRSMLTAVAGLFAHGVSVDWHKFEAGYDRRRVALPTYPFERERYWLEAAPVAAATAAPAPVSVAGPAASIQAATAATPAEVVLARVREMVGHMLHVRPDRVDVHASLLEMGADSLVLLEAVREIQDSFGVAVNIRQVFEHLTTVSELAAYIVEQMAPEALGALIMRPSGEAGITAVAAAPMSSVTDTGTVAGLDANALMNLMSQQLSVLSQALGRPVASPAAAQQAEPVHAKPGPGPAPTASNTAPGATTYIPFQPIRPGALSKLTARQEEHLTALVDRYTRRTASSKRWAEANRPVLADNRASAGFRLSIKEMLYPIVAERSAGARIWDLDGNEYIDLTMGFGVTLFGHNPPFVMAALSDQMQKGLQLGPQSHMAGEVAGLIAELTGMQRVAFTNSGTEAIMTAVRLARTATGRNKIALFTGSYHGTFDGILGRRASLDGKLATEPIAPGTSHGMVNDLLVLDYGTPEALALIRQHAHELAAVLVEPVQSRRPDLQPREFLQAVREVTAEAGAALIFDEVITGFRIHPSGAQAWYGIRADIATYGKVIGGGLPIGVVAGSQRFLDGIDGGAWQYGDHSYPQAETTFFAGTFCKHPLAMAAAHATLSELKRQGPALQEELNRRTERLAARLNEFFAVEAVPIQIIHYGSLFRFAFQGNMDLLFYHLMEQGIYIWEGRNCFLSTAHTDADVDRIVAAVKASVWAMSEGGFLLDKDPSPRGPGGGGAPLQYPLTANQQDFWVLSRLGDDGAKAGNESTVLRLRGPLAAPAIQLALQQVVDRHEALRTVFEPNAAWQEVLAAQPVAVPVIAIQEGEAAGWLDEESNRPFDLERGPLVRCTVLRLSVDHHLLVLTVHHIVVDGISIGVMLQELVAAYEAHEGGRPLQLAAPLQFREFASRVESRRAGAEGTADEAYWRGKFSDGLPTLDLPTDYPRPAVKTYRGARERIRLDGALYARLRRTARQMGATPFMFLLTAYSAFLHRMSGQAELVVGIPTGGRSLPGSDHLVGNCVNMSLVRSQAAEALSFADHLKAIRSDLFDVFEHDMYPLGDLVRSLGETRDTSRPIVAATFNLLPFPITRMGQLDLTPVPQPAAYTKFELTLDAMEVGEELWCDFAYNADLFDAGTIMRWLGHFQTLLSAAVAVPGGRLEELPLLTEGERLRLLGEWVTVPGNVPEVSVHELFETQVVQTPDAVAVACEATRWTYRELNRRANRLARRLRESGVTRGDLVGLCADRSNEMIAGLLAIIKAGAGYVALDPTFPPERLSFMQADAGLRVLLTQVHLAHLWAGASVTCIDLETAQCDDDDLNVNGGATAADLAYVIYTSGSTGRPKGVAVSHRNLVNYVQGVSAVLDLPSGASYATVSTLAADLGNTAVFPALLSGGTLHVITLDRATDPDAMAEYCRRNPIDCLKIVPSHLAALLSGRHPESVLPRKRLVLGGEASTRDLIRKVELLAPGCRTINHYGPTETTVGVLTHGADPAALRGLTVPIGRPLAGSQAYILDGELQPVPVGVPGELYIGGMGVTRGYLGRPDLTAERFLPDRFSPEAGARFYRTGDLARSVPDGSIEFLGRVDDQVKLRGFRVELGEIAAVLKQHPRLRAAIVLLRDDLPGEPRLVAYVVPADPSLATDDLVSYAREQLPAHMVPALFVRLETLPLSTNGKVDRRRLPAPDAALLAQRQAYMAPRTRTEQLLAGLWARTLGVEQISADSHFFHLGGHSLTATRLIARIREAMQLELPLRTIFEAPVLSDLARRIDGWGQTVPAVPVTSTAWPSDERPLSFAQHRLWFLAQLEPDSPFYNIPVAVRLTGSLDVMLLKGSLMGVLQRHESLRAVFESREGNPVQRVITLDRMPLTIADLTSLTGAEREEEALRRLTADARTPFDLARGPLVRVSVLRMGEQEHILQITMHHIVSDGWSHGVFLRELAALYDHRELPSVSVQYGDYARWQRESLQGAALKQQLDFWGDALHGCNDLLELPSDRRRPAVQSYRGGHRAFALPHALTTALKALSREEGVTLFMTLLATFEVLLHRYSGQADLCVGTDVAGRSQVETEGVIGCFVNTLVVRNNLSGNPTFRELLAQVRETTLGAYTHQDAPFEQVVDAVQPERSLSHTPLFQVAFFLENLPMQAMAFAGLQLTPITLDTGTAKFDMSLEMKDAADGLTGVVEYSTDLFDPDRIERLLIHFENLLTGVVGNPGERIWSIPVLSAQEHDLVLHGCNQTTADFPEHLCLHDLIEEQVRRTPDAVAVRYGGDTLTYAELDARANQLAHHLRKHGVGPDVTVGVCVDRSPELVVALMATLKAGGAFVPLETDAPAARLQQALSDARSPVLLSQSHLRDRLPESGAKIVLLDADWPEIADYPTEAPSVPVHPDHLVSIYYTSGSTGIPKGVASTHRGWVNRIIWMQQHKEMRPEDAILQKTTLTFDDAAVEFFWPLTVGASIALMEPGLHKDPRAILDAAVRYRVTVLQFVPSMLALFLEAVTPADRDRLGCLRHVISSGEALRSDLVRLFSDRLGTGVKLHNQWGATEVSIDSTVHTCTEADGLDEAIVPVGRPFDNNQCFVLDEYLQPVPMGAAGELYLAGVGLARCYLNDPAKTAAAFVPNPFVPGERMYRTGDRGYFRADRSIAFLGRRDDQVKIRGQRVELGEVEAVLATHPAVRDCGVVAHKRPDGYRLVGYYVIRSEAEGSADAARGSAESLRAYMRERLPEYMVPNRFVALASLPATISGKLDRKLLPDPGEERPELPEAYVLPATPTEASIAAIWSEILGVARVGVHDKFFALGGHSLDATRVISRINREFALALPLKVLFESPTVAELACRVAQQPGVRGIAQAPIPRLPAQTEYELSQAQERLWFEYQFDARNAMGYVFAIRLEGRLQPDAFREAFRHLVHRHSIMRTTFAEHDGVPYQIIRDDMEVPCPYTDLSDQAEAAQEHALGEYIQTEMARPFAFAAGPLFRAAIFKRNDEGYLFVLSVHPIAYDGWSTEVLARELSHLYEAVLTGSDVPALYQPVQYVDYAAWQNRRLRNGDLEAQRTYWLEHLTGEVHPLSLPADPPAVPERMVPRALGIPRALTDQLRQFSLEQGATLYMTMLAGWAMWLAQVSGESDLTIGSPLSGRTHPDLEEVLGLLVNPVAIRANLSGNPTGLAVLEQVREAALGAAGNQDFPFAHVIQARRQQGLAGPLYNVVFVLQNANNHVLTMNGLTLREYAIDHLFKGVDSLGDDPTMQIDLHLEVFEAGDQLKLVMKYNPGRFRSATIDDFLVQYQRVLDQFMAEPAQRLSELSLRESADLDDLFA